MNYIDVNEVSGALDVVLSTAASLYAAMPAKVVLIVIGLLFCFAGFKLLRWIAGLFGVGVGVTVAACAVHVLGGSLSEIVSLLATIAAMLVLGLLLGALFFRFYKLGVFLICAVLGVAIGYVPSLFVQEYSIYAFFGVLAVYGLLFGITGLLFLKPVTILLTSCFGFVAAFPALDLIGGQPNWAPFAAGAALTVLGIIVQFATNRHTVLPGGRKKRRGRHASADDGYDEDDEYEEDAENAAESTPDEPAAREDHADEDATQYIDQTRPLSENTTAEDEIEAISNTVAERLEQLDPTRTQAFVSTGVGAAAAAEDVSDDQTRVMHVDEMSDEPEDAADGTRYIPAADIPADEPERGANTEDDERSTQALRTQPLDASGTQALRTQTIGDGQPAAETEPTEPEDSVTYEEEDAEAAPEAEKRSNPLRILFPLVMLAVAGGFAAFGILYPEGALALIFICYALRFYKLTALAGLILAARSGLEVYYQLPNGFSLDMLRDGGSCLIYLVITFIAIGAALRARREKKQKS